MVDSGDTGMQVIARIPDVSVHGGASAAPESPADPRGPAPRQRGRDRILTGIGARWPTWPVAALAVIAVMTWMLASWNDHVRLERQRTATRLARQPGAAPACAPTPPHGAGAVVR